MLTTKRRGRPVGTDHKEDLEALALVADRLIADEILTPWPVMWAVCKTRKWKGSTDQAIVARWLRKWKTQSKIQLAAARERSANRRTRPAVVTIGALELICPQVTAELAASMQRVQAEIAGAAQQIARALDIPAMNTFREQHRKAIEGLAAGGPTALPAFEEIQRITQQMKNLPPINIPKQIWGG